MKSLNNFQSLKSENFHKICVVGGGITGAIMVLLLKKSKLFKLNEIGWISPPQKSINDLRTTFFNQESLKLLKNLNILKNLKKNDYTFVKRIEVFGINQNKSLFWDYSDPNKNFGAVISNNKILNLIENQITDVNKYESLVNNTKCNEFERVLYLKNKTSIKTHFVLSADGKNSYLRKLLSINTINKNVKDVAVSGFLKLSKDHNSTAIQAFTDLGPVGILPFGNKNIVNFVQTIKEFEYKKLSKEERPEDFLCNKLNKFFSHLDISFNPIKKVNNVENKLSYWDLDLNFIVNPTSPRTILIGDAAHSIHPLAGQGLNLSIRDCVSAINAIKKSLKLGNDFGDDNILNFYINDRLPKTIAMTAFTDFLFFGFTSTSRRTQMILTKGMETLNKTSLKNLFRDIASI